ncbi:hypothetical protein MNEG_0623 [Monoraphidium neglectum]|uniref:NTF2 domain-containing protein n=1 Tax=Monoraphidium neglectum TaxID=145388 RepID=A0A0D2NSZ7_9CHLO|nr:hypothetical protein MNEG_0623 [Monoraphidium neglectum]KIZ07336.1 hypothetical protein MNEG_0623 [Monoraphidium neglectum]|eukprot:XP_013906355.1 hypothetical protein MNEG_0623 [Monoraphidium neglectum]
MAAQTTLTAFWVADEFKKKYYDVLGNNPRLFMRFFKEDSTLTVVLPGADGQPQARTAEGPEGIQQLMQSTVPSAKVAVEALQAQYGVSTASPDQQAAAAAAAGAAPKPSVMDRVIVMHVVGRVVLHGERVERRFSQVFCLAPQTNPKGYYVRNDILTVHAPDAAAAAPRPQQQPAPPAAAAAPLANGVPGAPQQQLPPPQLVALGLPPGAQLPGAPVAALPRAHLPVAAATGVPIAVAQGVPRPRRRPQQPPQQCRSPYSSSSSSSSSSSQKRSRLSRQQR